MAHAALISCGGGPVNGIDAAGGVSTSCTIAGAGGTIDDVDLRLSTNDGGFNTYWFDMSFTLTHGAVSVVVNNDHDDFSGTPGILDIVFDDEALFALPTTGSHTGSCVPDNSLTAFDGLDPNGQWSIAFNDPTFPDEGSDLASWSVDIFTVPERATIALFTLGIAGLGLARWRRSAI